MAHRSAEARPEFPKIQNHSGLAGVSVGDLREWGAALSSTDSSGWKFQGTVLSPDADDRRPRSMLPSAAPASQRGRSIAHPDRSPTLPCGFRDGLPTGSVERSVALRRCNRARPRGTAPALRTVKSFDSAVQLVVFGKQVSPRPSPHSSDFRVRLYQGVEIQRRQAGGSRFDWVNGAATVFLLPNNTVQSIHQAER